MIKITIKTLQKITWLFFMILFINCSQNFEPIIKSITAVPNPAQPNEKVILKCIAIDDDEENVLKNESLDYNWFASYGQLSINTTDSTSWIAPNESGEYSITCSVSDQYNGLDILSINITVE